jgi:hypothetical protein
MNKLKWIRSQTRGEETEDVSTFVSYHDHRHPYPWWRPSWASGRAVRLPLRGEAIRPDSVVVASEAGLQEQSFQSQGSGEVTSPARSYQSLGQQAATRQMRKSGSNPSAELVGWINCYPNSYSTTLHRPRKSPTELVCYNLPWPWGWWEFGWVSNI